MTADEEAKKLMEEFDRMIAEADANGNLYRTTVIPEYCSHKWKKYIGITNRFWFCELCDEKAKWDEVIG